MNEQQCSTVTETVYEQDCTTVEEQKCEVQYMTKYEQQCTTVNEQVQYSSDDEDHVTLEALMMQLQ